MECLYIIIIVTFVLDILIHVCCLDALHIVINRREYGNPEQTIQLLQTCNKGKKINCWESFYIQDLQQQNLLMDEQKVGEPSPLYTLTKVTRRHVT